MGVLVHPDQQVHPAVQRALDDGRLRAVSNHRSGHPWLLARHWERTLTEVRTKHLDIVILSHLDGETATAVVLLAQGRRTLEELDDLQMLLPESTIVIAKDEAGETRVEGALAGQKRAVWVEEGSVAFVSDDRGLLMDIFALGGERQGRDPQGDDRQERVGWMPLWTVPTGMWLHTNTGAIPRVRAVAAAGAARASRPS